MRFEPFTEDEIARMQKRIPIFTAIGIDPPEMIGRFLATIAAQAAQLTATRAELATVLAMLERARRVIDHAKIDFPFIFARPEVLSTTQQLMADKIFDELGALPQSQRNADPMVVGIIRESAARNAKVMTFLAIWFLDTKTL